MPFNRHGQILASGSEDKTIKLWDGSKGKLIRTLVGNKDWVSSVAIALNDQTLASGSDGSTVKL